MTITEAQQCGCVPIVLDTYSSLKDLIETGKDGLIVKDEEEMKLQLLSLVREEGKRKEMAVYATETCRRFLPEYIYEKYYNLFCEVVGR
jgi:glycosyltransferase involved in cell wall biosynthesis